jgi:N-glycosylase/DNA lyase
MSKVYSFRLSDDNPREVQAKEVIEAWMEEGYSIRYLVTDALVSFSQKKSGREDWSSLMEYLENIIQKMETREYKQDINQENSNLPSSFVSAVKKSAKSGIRS